MCCVCRKITVKNHFCSSNIWGVSIRLKKQSTSDSTFKACHFAELRRICTRHKTEYFNIYLFLMILRKLKIWWISKYEQAGISLFAIFIKLKKKKKKKKKTGWLRPILIIKRNVVKFRALRQDTKYEMTKTHKRK